MRVTLDLDSTVHAELRRRSKQSGETMSGVASALLATALREASPKATAFLWQSQPLGLTVDLEDKDAVASRLDR